MQRLPISILCLINISARSAGKLVDLVSTLGGKDLEEWLKYH